MMRSGAWWGWAVAALLVLAACQAGATAGSIATVSPPPHLLATLYRAQAASEPRSTGQAWLALDDPVRAVQAWAGGSLADATLPDLTALAGAAMLTGDLALARRALTELAFRNSNDVNAQLDLGLLLAAIAPAEAAAHLDAAAGEPAFAGEALSVAEALARGPEAAGWALYARQQWPYAEIAFLQSAAGPGLTPVAQAALALSRDYQGKDGRSWMDRAVLQAPDEAQVRALQAIHLRLSGDLEASLTAQLRAVALAPDSPAMLAGLGAAYQRLGQLDEARVWFERAQALAGEDARFQALLDSAAQSEAAALDALLKDLADSIAPGAP